MSAQETLQKVLKDSARSAQPGSLLLYPQGETRNPVKVTYTQLYQKANHISHIIRSLEHFKFAHPVLLHFDDHWDNILWFWSVLFAGGLPVLSSPFSNVEDDRHGHIRALSGLLQSPVCLSRSRLLHLFGNSHDIHLHSIEHLLQESVLSHAGKPQWDAPTSEGDASEYLKSEETQKIAATSSYVTTTTNIEAYGSHENKDVLGNSRELAMLMLTSASTGNAKAVQFTHGQVMAAIRGKAAVRRLPLDQPFLNWIGLDHVAGLIEVHLQALWLGVDQVHVSAADIVPSPKLFLDLISRHRVSRTFAPNFFLAKLVPAIMSAPTKTMWNLASLVCIASGGEANDIETLARSSALLERYGAPRGVIIPGFGMTETCAGAIFNLDHLDKVADDGLTVASVGRCMDGIEMRVVTHNDRIAAPEEVGSLEVRGPVVFEAYYGNREATSHAFSIGNWFRTGDQGVIDSNGKLTLAGRAKDVINVNGIKFITADIQAVVEQALAERVARLAVFPSRISHTEQVTIAYVPKTFPACDEQMLEIQRLAIEVCLMSTSTRPFIFALREQSLSLLPISTLGKISRLKMARLFDNGHFDQDIEQHECAMRHAVKQVYSTGPDLMNEAETCLMYDVAETLDIAPEVFGIHASTCLFDVGLTSMHLIKLKNGIEQRLGRDISIITIMKNPSIRSLAAELDVQLQKLQPEETPVVSYNPVVVLRENGSKAPLWLFHPGVGEVLVFVGLAQRLATDDRPVFALRAAGFEPGQQHFSSIEQAVSVYVAAIRQRQPGGPYAMAGYSYGTMLAFETAKRLVAGGDEVRFLGSFNLPPHIKGRISQLGWNACLLHLAHFLGFVTEDVADTFEADEAFRALPRAEAMISVLHMADKNRVDELGLDARALGRWVDVAFGLQRLATDYDPSGKVDNIDVFHAVPLKAAASSRQIWLREHLSRWADFVYESPRFHAVQGAHYTMIGPQYVTTFAQTLIGALRARGV